MLPTGGWGYAYFPYAACFVRLLGLPTLSHTGRFFKSWGDNTSLKPEMALKYECCQILSQGMTLGVGDLLHPRGIPDKAVYKLIGRVYKYIKDCEKSNMGMLNMKKPIFI
ncbi:MAG: beta-galactosidase, partial [Clostridiales bacterium]|nr:beta-galactosidase [Clostridiales bacterium]